MNMKNRSVWLSIMLMMFSVSVFAQTKSPIPMQGDKGDSKKMDITVLVTPPASNNSDDYLFDKYVSKLPERSSNSWMFIDVAFPVLKPEGKAAWGEWLDDLEVVVEYAIPGRSLKGKAQWIVLAGRQPLNPVQADGKVHHVRFFIPPYALIRYALGKGDKKELKKFAEEMPILATIYWKDKPISMIFRGGKNMVRSKVVETFSSLRDSRSGYFENVILPAEYTPWAGRNLERFESMKIEQQRRR